MAAFFVIFFSVLILHASSAQIISTSSGGLSIKTEQGLVSGTSISSGVRQFLGVPFASAKRWEAPSKPSRFSSFRATAFSDSCVQAISPANAIFSQLLGGGGVNVSESEDCLSVNIWAPSLDRKQKTAVLLWVYGGDFQLGTVSLISSCIYLRWHD